MSRAIYCTMLIAVLGQPVFSGVASAQFELSDERSGMTCEHYHGAAKLAWQKRGGDWRDANDVLHGDQPYVRSKVSPTRETQVVEWDVTELARAWEDGVIPVGGLFLRQLADDASSVRFHSREAEGASDHPRLIIEWDNAPRSELHPSADATMTCSSSSGAGQSTKLHVGGNRSTILVFPFQARRDARVLSARLILVSDKQYRAASDIGVFRLFAPFAKSLHEKPGLAVGYRLDAGIESHPSVVFATGFESRNWLADWSSISQSSVAKPIDRDDANRFVPLSGRALKVTIEEGKKVGLNLLYRFKEETGVEPEEMYVRYYLRFGDDWRPRVSGKMPGFAGTYGKAGWGGRRSDGTDGWSARGSYSVSSALRDGEYSLGSYVYHAAMSMKYGDGWGWNLGPTGVLEKNRWYSVEQYLKLNEPGRDNGVLKAWIDGVPVFERTDIRFRESSDLRIETLWMNVYHGGTTQAPSDLSLYIDNLVIASEYIGPASPR